MAENKKKVLNREWWRDFGSKILQGLVVKAIVAIVIAAFGAATVFIASRWSSTVKIQAPILLGLLLILGVGGGYVVVAFRKLRRQNSELQDFKLIAESCGIEGFSPFTTPEDKKKGWDHCVERIAGQRFTEFQYAGCTGAKTFADRGSPLLEVLQAHQGNIKILLINRDSEAFEQRVEELAGSNASEREKKDQADTLRAELDRALRFCVDLGERTKSISRSIEVRAYDRPAIWKMVIIGGYLWLQHYAPGKKPNDSPAYFFRRGEGTMTRPLESIFWFRWNMSRERDRILFHQNEAGKVLVAPNS